MVASCVDEDEEVVDHLAQLQGGSLQLLSVVDAISLAELSPTQLVEYQFEAAGSWYLSKAGGGAVEYELLSAARGLLPPMFSTRCHSRQCARTLSSTGSPGHRYYRALKFKIYDHEIRKIPVPCMAGRWLAAPTRVEPNPKCHVRTCCRQAFGECCRMAL